MNRKGLKYNVKNRKGRTKTLTIGERYERYINQIESRTKSLIKRGFMPKVIKTLGDDYKLTWKEFERAYNEARKKGASATNATREIISSQLYGEATNEEANNLLFELKEHGITADDGKEWTITGLRTADFREGLAKLNEQLKKSGLTSGYARERYISTYVFDSK